jgi:hypothetical protein
MKKFLLVLFFLSWGAVAQTAKTTGAWLPVDTKWEHAPPTINPRLETGSTTVLYFEKQGRFALVECVVNREAGRYITLSQGDGQVIFIGEWDGHLPGKVRYQLVSRTVTLEGEKLPGLWHSEALASKNGLILFRGRMYRHVGDLGPSIRKILPSTPVTK